jgi:hypothetical protein
MPRQLVQQRALSHPQGDIVQLVAGTAQPGGGEPHQLHGITRQRLVGDQRVGGVDAELRLGGPGGRPAPQPGQLLAQQVLAAGLVGGGDAGAFGPGKHVR